MPSHETSVLLDHEEIGEKDLEAGQPCEENVSMSDLATLMESVAVDPLVDHPADFHVFHQFLELCKRLPPITTSVCWPGADVALRGAVEAADAGIILPTLVGPEDRLRTLAKKIGVDISGYPIVDAATEQQAAQISVAMCRDGRAL